MAPDRGPVARSSNGQQELSALLWHGGPTALFGSLSRQAAQVKKSCPGLPRQEADDPSHKFLPAL